MKQFEFITLECITYDCGDEFDIEKFEPVRNEFHSKPRGGLWASPVDSEFGWYHWSSSNEFGDLNCSFKFRYAGNTIVIRSYDDLKKIVWRQGGYPRSWPDYEAMYNSGVDAIYLTADGVSKTRYTRPDLDSWDCESIFIMNPNSITENRHAL